MHVHDLIPFQTTEFDTSHVIDKLSFGAEYPGAAACARDAPTLAPLARGCCVTPGTAAGGPGPAGQADAAPARPTNPAGRVKPAGERAGMKNPLDRVRVPRHNPRNVEGRTGAYQYYLKARARALRRAARACAACALCCCLWKALTHLRKRAYHYIYLKKSQNGVRCSTAHSPSTSLGQIEHCLVIQAFHNCSAGGVALRTLNAQHVWGGSHALKRAEFHLGITHQTRAVWRLHRRGQVRGSVRSGAARADRPNDLPGHPEPHDPDQPVLRHGALQAERRAQRAPAAGRVLLL